MKNRIKRLAAALMAVGMVMGFGSVAFAGGGHGKHRGAMFEKLEKLNEQERLEYMEEKLDERVERMTNKVDLSAAQQTQVRQIFADAQTQMLEIWERNKNSDDKTAARSDARNVMKQARTEVADVLTDEQKAKFRQHKRGKKGHHGKKAFMIEKLDERLELSDQQEVQVKQILDETHAELKQARANASSKEEMRGKGKVAFEQAATKINAVLDADQREEFAELRQEMKDRRGKKGHKRGEHGKRGNF